MSKSAASLLDWAWGFMCNAKPFAERLKAQGDYGWEADQWLDAFETFRPEFFAWLDKYAHRNEQAAEPVVGLDGMIVWLRRSIEGSEETGSPIGLIHVDSAREVLEHLTRLQDLEK